MTMTDKDLYTIMELAEAYRVLRNAFHHDLGEKTEPPLSPLQERVQQTIARISKATKAT